MMYTCIVYGWADGGGGGVENMWSVMNRSTLRGSIRNNTDHHWRRRVNYGVNQTETACKLGRRRQRFDLHDAGPFDRLSVRLSVTVAIRTCNVNHDSRHAPAL